MVFTLCLLCHALLLGAQDVSSSFPSSWTGRWEGDLLIHPAGGYKDVKMALEIFPGDSLGWHWTLIYIAQGREDRREYRLQPVDPAKGRWRIDERNGIILGARLLGNALFSVFEVGGTMLQARYSLEGDALRFEITTHGMDPIITGGVPAEEGEAVPEVKWYEVGAFQQAFLRKVG